MNFLRHLFTELNSEYSYYLYTWMIGSFLIGWIARYFLAKRRQKALNVMLEKSKLELKQSKKQQTAIQGKLDLKEADYKKASLELKDKNTLVDSLGTEKRQLNTRLNATLGDFEKMKVEHTQTTARLEELNDQILGLRTKNAQLNTEIQQSNQTINQYADTQSSVEEQEELRNIIKRLQAENTSLKKQSTSAVATTIPNEVYESKLTDAKAEIAQLEEGNEALSNSLSTLVEQNEAMQEQLAQLPQYEEGNAALNASILQLIEQNELLKAQVEDLNQYESGNDILNSTISQLIEENESLKVNTPTEANAVVSAIPITMSSEELDTEQAKAEIRAAIGKQISMVAASEKDDLKKINGIGPFIEEKLNDLGIYSFHQVSQLDGLLPVLTTAIEFFPGRIERDEWIGQADRLAFMKKSSNSRRRTIKASSIPDESFTTEKTAVQEKIIVGDKPIKRVIRRAPIRRVVKAEPSIQKVEVKASPEVELPTVPVPPVEKVTPPASSTTSLKSAVSRKIVVPPVTKTTTPDPRLAERKAAAEKAAAEKKAEAERKAAEERKVEAERKVAAEKKVEAERKAAEERKAEAERKVAAERKAEAERKAATEKKAEAEKKVAVISSAEEDLKKIEGIGPKLSKVLNNAGINNFKQLADKSVSELQDILDDAGPRYRIARPKSWPLQAAMAAAGEWDKLKDFQEELRGGIMPD